MKYRNAFIFAAILFCLCLTKVKADAPIKVETLSEIRPGGNYDISGVTLHEQVGLDVNNVHITGLHISDVHNGLQNENAALRIYGRNVTLDNVLVENCTGGGIGIFGSGIILNNPISRNNGHFGIGASAAKNVRINGGEISNNNRGISDPPWKNDSNAKKIDGDLYVIKPGWEGGGGKWANTDDIIFNGTKSHDNGGPGIWFDISNHAVTFNNVEAYGNVGITNDWLGVGIAIEISWGPVVINNCYFHDNTGAGVALWEAEDVKIQSSHFANGLEMRNLKGRAEQHHTFNLRNIRAAGNIFYGKSAIFVSAADIKVNDEYRKANSIVTDTNTFNVNLPANWKPTTLAP